MAKKNLFKRLFHPPGEIGQTLLFLVVYLPAVFICLATLLVIFAILTQDQHLREAQSMSNFTVVEDSLYFGGGYHLYRLDLSTHLVETIFSPDRIRVEQPIIADGVAYFGGRGLLSRRGFMGDDDTFFALDLQSRQLRWRLDLDRDEGYGTYGTYPVIAGDQILVCARQHLYCVNRHTGKVLWKIDTWLGDGGGVTRPYIFKDLVYYKINEDSFSQSREDDGHWAVVELASGQRQDILPIAEKPGTYKDVEGHGNCVLVDGVLYGATRVFRFGAIDLKAERLLWEYNGQEKGLGWFSLHTPAVNDKVVFTAAGNSLYAFERENGTVRWKAKLGPVISPPENSRRPDWTKVHFVATNELVIARGDKGVGAWRSDTGNLLWSIPIAAGWHEADPLILGRMAVVSSSSDCRVLALDLKTGKELWSVNIPDCAYYYRP